MQLLIIAGTVGKDAVLRRTQGGEPVLGFSVAVNNGKDKNTGSERPPLWVDAAIWGKRGEALERHITKGTKVTLHGRPTVRSHDGNAYLGIVVDDITFQGGTKSDRDSDRDDYGSRDGGKQKPRSLAPTSSYDDMDDEIPF